MAAPRLDHIIFATPDLEAQLDRVESHTGVRPAPGGRHPSLGTVNALLSLGEAYVEFMAADRSARPAGPRPFALDERDAGELVAWVLRTTRVDALVAAAESAGFELGPVREQTRLAPEARELRWRVTSRRDPEGAVACPLLIDWGDTPNPALTAPTGCTLEAFDVRWPDAASQRRLLAAIGADATVLQAGRPGLRAVIRGPAGAMVLT